MKLKRLYSLRYRIAVTIFFLEIAMITFVLWSTLSFSENQTKKQLMESEKVVLNLLGSMSSVALFSVQYDELQGYVSQLAKDPHILKIRITNNKNIVVVSSDFNEIGSTPSKLVDAGAKFWRSKPVYNLGMIAIQYSNEQLDAATGASRNFGTSIALACISVIAFVGWFIGYWLTRRLSILTTAAQKFKRGDTSVRTRFSGYDEIAVLGDAFEQMRDRIDEYIEQLEHDRNELKFSHDLLEQRVQERTAELSDLNRKLRILSEYDELTRTYNRRKFDEIIKRECAAAARGSSPITLVVIDIDYFKAYNDNYGHQEGDDILTRVAASLAASLNSPSDFLARYGGEEFVAILPSTGRLEANNLAETMRKNVESMVIPHEYSPISSQITISIGVAVAEYGEGITPEDIFACADKALYQAKKSGRNQICVLELSENKVNGLNQQ